MRTVDDNKTERVTKRAPRVAIYETDAHWPPKAASISEAWMGTHRLARLTVYPVQYNPVTKSVLFHRSIRVEMTFED